MTMLEAVGSCFSKYATFSGRASRSEYWWFFLFNMIVSIVLGFVQGAAGQEVGISDFYNLAIIIPSIAVACRRLHDIGRSGWWQLIFIIPILGWVLLLVWYCTKGEQGENRFGAIPADNANQALV